jgi:hypothetical protein
MPCWSWQGRDRRGNGNQQVFAGIVIAWDVAEHNITLSNPLQPVIRIMERRQVHRHEMQKLRLRAELARKGMDPDYIGFLEKKGHNP